MGMSSEQVLVHYGLKDIINFKSVNNVLPQELEKWCLSKNNNHTDIKPVFEKSMSDIINSLSKGINPNDLMLKNNIRSILNKMCKDNFKKLLKELMSLDFDDRNQFSILAEEI